MRVVFAPLAVAILVVAAAVGLPAGLAGASQADLERAQKRANQAAAELAKTQSQLAVLQSEASELRQRKEANENRLRTLKSTVRDIAISQYVAGNVATPTGDFNPDLSATARNQVLSRYVAESTDDDLDEYRKLAEDLAKTSEELSAKEQQSSATAADLRKRVAVAEAELKKLIKFEAERLAAEKVRRDREAARAKAASSKGGPVLVTGDWVCPVQGPRSYTDDWGDPRGGGRRRHQGTDILAPRGTRVVAPVAGSVHRNDSSNGGISFYLNGVDGIEYYGAHLDSYVGGTGSVAKGEVVGYVGNTGNARGGPPHLHFEIHPGGGRPVNPYPTVRRYCG